ncbi:hypothetical protein SVIO_104880 [Streptomyces violaceusniger]|uniref:Cyclic nucleotide-binding domain-containing protein n=1 Tax=Streptomyces violaceusniger TaxID=68280 RepID=A0A4D4LFV4_STRVO|nr:hypothetical protein SVIO_104880 [Streptomyces violaceusniger]
MTGGPLLLDTLPRVQRDRLFTLADERDFRAGSALFDEGGVADRFWLIRSGEVALDVYVPGRRAQVVETLGPRQQLGWSWIFPRIAGTWAPGLWGPYGPGSFRRPRYVSCAWPIRSWDTS